jgi:hypothetical protein
LEDWSGKINFFYMSDFQTRMCVSLNLPGDNRDGFGTIQPEIEQLARRKESQWKGSSLLDPGLRVKSLAVSQVELRATKNPFPDVLDIQHTGISQRLGLLI